MTSLESSSRMSNPCSNCRRVDQGKLRYVYVTTFESEERVPHRLRLCPVCWEAFIPDLIAPAEIQDQFGRWLAPEQA